MFPNRQAMIRAANALWGILFTAPILYLLLAAIVTGENGGLSKNTDFLPLFLGLSIASAANISLVVYIQTSSKFMAVTGKLNPATRTFYILSIGSILSESPSIYGLVITLVSGTLTYELGLTALTWASLIWVRTRFSSNLKRNPEPGTATSL